jgi:uncharacterized protein Usg
MQITRDQEKLEWMMVRGYRLCTYQIEYWMPDAPEILCPNPFIGQIYDLRPRYPELRGFLDWWTKNIEGRLNRVLVSTKDHVTPAEFRFASGLFDIL